MIFQHLLRNKRFVFYISGFSLLGILLFFNIKDLYLQYKINITNEVGRKQLLIVRTLANQFNKNLISLIQGTDIISHLISQSQGNSDYILENTRDVFTEFYLEGSSQVNESDCSIISIRWIDVDGNEMMSVPINNDPLSSIEVLKMASLAPASSKKKDIQIIGPILSPEDIKTMWFTGPVTDRASGADLGVAAVEVNLEKLVSHTFSSDFANDGSSFYIVDNEGYIIYSPDNDHMFMGNFLKPEENCFSCHKNFDFPREMIHSSEGWGLCEISNDSNLNVFSTIKVADSKWSVLLGSPRNSLYGLIQQFHRNFSIVLFIILGIIGLLTSFLIDLHRKRMKAEEQAKYLQQRTALLRDREQIDQQYIELVENAPDALYILQDTQFVLVNRAFEELLGYTREEVRSPDFDFMEAVAPEDRDYIIERGERQKRGEEVESIYEFATFRKDGKKIYVEVSVRYIQYKGEEAVQGVVRNISERKREEKQRELMLSLSNTIRDSREPVELARNALECVTQIYEMSIGTLYIYDDNRNELQLIAHKGIGEEELSVQECYRVDDEEKGIAVQTALRREIITIEDIATDTLLSYIPDRSRLKGFSLISIPLIAQEVLFGVLQFAQDRNRVNWDSGMSNLKQITNAITIGLHRRKISAELAESERHLKHLFENSKEIIYTTTSEGKFKKLNKAGFEFFGITGDKHGEYLDDVDINGRWKADINREEWIERMERDSYIENMEMKYLGEDGKVHTFLESAVAMRDDKGEIIEFQGMMMDITSIKEAQEETKRKNIELEKVNTELRELDRLKDNFISTISHELRTPLTSIKGSLDILLKGMMGELEDKIQNILCICQRNSERLIDLVGDLLEIQHLESGKSALDLGPVELESLIPGVVEKATQKCKERNIRLMTRINPDSRGKIIMADPSKITSAMSNLVSNAIKFSDKGTVLVELAHSEGEVHLSVIDDGIGIPENMHNKIFGKFTQADSGITRKRGGTGLGLAITRTIVEKHGGRIWVESREGSGSRFTFSLPCSPDQSDYSTNSNPEGKKD
jgi:PAS domain S-box-containing protein